MSSDVDTFYGDKLGPALDKLRQLRTSRWRILALLVFICLAVAVAAAGFFGFTVVGGADAWPGFAVGLGLSAGPAILLSVLAYLMVVRDPLHAQFERQILLPILHEFSPDKAQDIFEAQTAPTPTKNPFRPVVDDAALRDFIDTVARQSGGE